MNRIYCISGLGADHRLFQKLAINGYELVPVHWVTFDKSDTLPSYAQKLSEQITGKDPVIIGLSFGGMLAVEIAKYMPVKKVFIISSAKGSVDLSVPGGGFVKWIIKSGLLPSWIFTVPNPVVLNYLGARTSEEKELLKSIIRNGDGLFMKRALMSIINWKNESCPGNVVQIHGTSDKVIRSGKVHPDFWIEGGTHMMIHGRAGEVSKIISDCLYV